MLPLFRRLVLTLAPLPLLFLTHSDLERLAKASLAKLDGRVVMSGLRDSVEVVRDRWGVPHIYARNTDDLFFAQGFVQAQDRLWQMEMYRRTFEGSLAEILGSSYVRHDRLVRLLKYRGPFDDREWEHYHPEGRRIFDAFARGVNAFIAQAGDNLPVEFKLTGLRPKPWTAEIALLRTQTAMPIGDALAELRLARNVARFGTDSANALSRPSPFRRLVVPVGVDYSLITDEVIAALTQLRTGVVRPEILPQYKTMVDSPSVNRGAQESSPGSTNWVVAARRSANGHVIVANDPHRNVANPSIRYIVHLNAPGWNVIGATEPVLPGVMIGHTGRIAWGLTIVGTDQSDVYIEEVNPVNHNQARFRGRWEPMRIVIDTIRVKAAAPVIVTHKFTRHGPVFYEDTLRHKAFALRSTMHLPGSAGYLSALRYHALDDCMEFLEAQRYYLAPTENMICGDTGGNIAWRASSAAPKRPNWHGRLPVPGDGEYEWDGLRDDLPSELNPARGWIATANHDIHPQNYDPPLFFKNTPQDARYRRIADVLSGGRKLTLEDHKALQHDAYDPDGDKATLFDVAPLPDTLLETLRRELVLWDGQHRRDSRAAAVFRFVRRIVDTDSIPHTAGSDSAAARRYVASVLSRAADSLRARIGRDPATWRWGHFNRSEFPHALARAYDIPAVERHGGSGFVAAVGATYRQIIDITEPDSSVATNAPGQSGQPASAFYSNLVEMYGRAEYFPLAYSRAMVERYASHRLTLSPPK